jgi:diphthamide biosynthesis protein 3
MVKVLCLQPTMQAKYEEYFKQASRMEDDELAFYDEVDIKEFEFRDGKLCYPCPCGDSFEITAEELRNGEIIARCPSCSLIVNIIYEEEDIQKYLE